MSITELDTFVRKFHQLWNDGFTAHLDMDTQAGNAWVGLRLNLGQVPGPIHGHAHHPPRQHVPPSRLRRRARREAVRHTFKAENAEDANEERIVAGNTEQVATTAEIQTKPCIGVKNDDNIENVAEQVTEVVDVADEICPDIEFFAVKDNDAVADDEDIEVVFTSNYAEEDVLDSLKELFDDNLLPTLPKLVSRERVEQRSADHLCKVKLTIPCRKKEHFVWPVLRGYPDFFKNVKML